MAGSLVSSSLATLPPRSQIVYKNSTCQPIGLHGSILSSNRCSQYRLKHNQLAKIVTKSKRNVVVYSGMVPPEVDSSLPTSIGIPDSWPTWLMGAVVTIGLPFLTNKWGPLLGWMEKVKGTLQATENIAEAVEDIAEKVDKMAEEIEAGLPEGQLKNALRTVELAAEEVARDADRLDQLIDKVQEMEEKFEDMVEEGNEVAKEIKASKQI